MTISRCIVSASTKKRFFQSKIYFTLLFSQNLEVKIYCLFYSSLHRVENRSTIRSRAAKIQGFCSCAQFYLQQHISRCNNTSLAATTHYSLQQHTPRKLETYTTCNPSCSCAYILRIEAHSAICILLLFASVDRMTCLKRHVSKNMSQTTYIK